MQTLSAGIPCAACDGTGKVYDAPCFACGGTGALETTSAVLCHACDGSGEVFAKAPMSPSDRLATKLPATHPDRRPLTVQPGDSLLCARTGRQCHVITVNRVTAVVNVQVGHHFRSITMLLSSLTNPDSLLAFPLHGTPAGAFSRPRHPK